jgi:hypothetical protein
MSKAVQTLILAFVWLLRVAAQNFTQPFQTLQILPNDCGRVRLHSDSPERATFVVNVQLPRLVRRSNSTF